MSADAHVTATEDAPAAREPAETSAGPRTALRTAGWLVVLALGIALAADGVRKVRAHVAPLAANTATDALPLYLYPRTVDGGGDPSVQEDLAAAYARDAMTARAATFSNLYPATITPMMRPLARGGWERFVTRWRVVLLASAAIAGACGAAAGVDPRRRLQAAAIGAVGAGVTLRLFPVTPHCVALGQANLAIGALLGVAMLAWGQQREDAPRAGVVLDAVAGAALGVGTALKLVPAIGLAFALLSRRWATLLAAALVGGAFLALSLPWGNAPGVPLERIVTGIRGAMAFHGALVPDWIWMDGATPLEALVNAGRHLPLLALTLLLGGMRVRAAPKDGAAGVGALALAAAWLAADSAAVHWLYTPLLLPALAWVTTWPLSASSRNDRFLAVLAAGMAAGGWTLYLHDWLALTAFPRMVMASAITWLAVAVRVVTEGAPWKRRDLGILMLGVLLAGAHTAWRAEHPAPIEPLPRGVGNGGPRPGGDAPLPRPPER